MKTLLKSLLVAFTLTLISFSFAQADLYKPIGHHKEVAAQNKWKNDPTYSTTAYKHPTKVAAARQWASESGIEFGSGIASRRTLPVVPTGENSTLIISTRKAGPMQGRPFDLKYCYGLVKSYIESL